MTDEQQTTYTPGPWDANRRSALVVKNGLLVANCAHTAWTDNVERSNARLIAAAPELLEVLEEMIEAPPEGWTILDAERLHTKARELISKAKGATC